MASEQQSKTERPAIKWTDYGKCGCHVNAWSGYPAYVVLVFFRADFPRQFEIPRRSISIHQSLLESECRMLSEIVCVLYVEEREKKKTWWVYFVESGRFLGAEKANLLRIEICI